MFKKTQRLNTSEFAEYFKNGRRHNFPEFTIVTEPTNTLKTAVVVGKKVSKSAVKRNLIKRRVFAGLRENLKNNNLKSAIIVIVKPSYNNLPRKIASKHLKDVINQLVEKLK